MIPRATQEISHVATFPCQTPKKNTCLTANNQSKPDAPSVLSFDLDPPHFFLSFSEQLQLSKKPISCLPLREGNLVPAHLTNLVDMQFEKSPLIPSFKKIVSMKQAKPLYGVNHPATMLQNTRNRVCTQYPEKFLPAFEAGNCENRPQSFKRLYYHEPWCNRFDLETHIAHFECGYVDPGTVMHEVTHNVFTESGHVVLKHNEKLRLDPANTGISVIDVDVLATIGTSIYPEAYGHFPNDLLPRLLQLDRLLHAEIPLLWPNFPIPLKFLKEMLDQGIINKNRTIVLADYKKYYRAKHLFVYNLDNNHAFTPLTSHHDWSYQANILRSKVEQKEVSSKFKVGVLMRPGSRSISNHGDLMKALNDLTGVRTDMEVVEFTAGGESLFELGKFMNSLNMFIGAHGAGMNNMFWCQKGATVIEIGFYDSGFSLPAMYYCTALRIGLNYYSSFAVSGGYGSALGADVPEIVQIVRNEYRAWNTKRMP